MSPTKGGAFDLYITNSEGQTHQVTDGLGNVFTPDWVSNSRYIAFAAGVGINFDIYIVKPDGADLQQVTTSEAKDYQPRWSPDGNLIMFVSERDGNPDVYITNESGDLLRVTDDSAADITPAWEP